MNVLLVNGAWAQHRKELSGTCGQGGESVCWGQKGILFNVEFPRTTNSVTEMRDDMRCNTQHAFQKSSCYKMQLWKLTVAYREGC